MKIRALVSRRSRVLPVCALLLGVTLSVGFLFYTDRAEHGTLLSSAQAPEVPTVILDPGHGGADPGAISAEGLLEKELNLAVAKKLGAFLENEGVRVIYTRTDDSLLDSGKGGSRKTRDLTARVELARAHPNALFISLHMNTLPDEKYSGLQVFYSQKSNGGKALASSIQNTVVALLQPDNQRKAKDSAGSIFILDRIPSTAVLVECGFLSNKAEAGRLSDPVYQCKLAYSLSRCILDFAAESVKI